jgi:hypothetical protein
MIAHQETHGSVWNEETSSMSLSPFPVADTCPFVPSSLTTEIPVHPVHLLPDLANTDNLMRDKVHDLFNPISTAEEKPDIWRGSLMKIFGKHILPPKIDPLKVFHAFANFLKSELSKVFKLDRKRVI